MLNRCSKGVHSTLRVSPRASLCNLNAAAPRFDANFVRSPLGFQRRERNKSEVAMEITVFMTLGVLSVATAGLVWLCDRLK